MIDLSAENLALLKRIISEHLPSCEIRVFGSRVEGNAKPYSDIDIAIRCGEKIDRKLLNALKEALQESTLPIRVDLLDWHSISEEFREVIEKRYEVL